MKKYLFIFLSSISVIVFAQQAKINSVDRNSFLLEVTDLNPKYLDLQKENFTIRDFFEFTDPSAPKTFKLPAQTIYLAIPVNSKISISDLSYNTELLNKVIPEVNPSAEIKDSAIVFIPNDLFDNVDFHLPKEVVEVESYFYFRDFYIAQLKINNYRFLNEQSSIEVLKNIKFKVNLSNNSQINIAAPLKITNDFDKAINNLISNQNIAEQFRTVYTYQLDDTTGNWINYNSTYLKLGVARNGIVRIYKNNLESSGVSAALIDPRTFKLFESGKEIKIIVNGEDDASFDEGDYIEFWGHKNYPAKSYRLKNNSNEEYNEYINRYTDTTFYFLTWDGVNGIRVDTLSIDQTNITDTLNYYSELFHAESQTQIQFCDADETANQTPNWFRNKTWYWSYLFSQSNFNISLNNIYPDKGSSVFTKLVSFASNIAINSHQVKLFINNIQIDSASINRFDQLVLNGNINSSGLINGTNQLKMQNIANGSNPNALIMDWYEIEYPKYLNLINDSLYFKIANDAVPGLQIIKIGNAAQTSYRIYKIKPQLKVIENYSLSSGTIFFADSVSPGDQYYIISGERSVTPKIYYAKMFENLRSVVNQTDYIAITHPKFFDAVQNYVQVISNLYNVSTSVFNIQDIYDEFSFGYPYPESVRLFTNVLYNNVQSPKPTYLSLIGDANYDYNYYLGTSGGYNYVPSYGIPVGDNWFVLWDPNAIAIPQLKVGRLPINEVSELNYYLTKIQNNESKPFNEWNKKYLFFSGGRADVSGELEYLKSANDSVISKFVVTRPVSGSYMHFYKTRNPQSDFGPYTPEEISKAISAGSLFISYIGHSGTATWDNSINSTSQLLNTVDRNPLITDFGCSTNKYAEPNIVCFGERFLFSSSGQALGYIGNSSLGFQSTAVTAPIYFYEELFQDSLSEIGNASLYSKIKLITQNGNNPINRIFSLTNLVLGDPSVRLKIPKLPNFKITAADIINNNTLINENDDSVQFKIALKNLGLSEIGNLEIKIDQIYEGNTIKSELKTIPVPGYADTISVWMLTKQRPGNHLLNVQIDPDNIIPEIYEDDNSISFSFSVFSSSLRDLLTSQTENPSLKNIKLLNPVNYESDSISIELQLSQSADYSNSTVLTFTADTFYTKVNLPELTPMQRYYLRYKILLPGSYYSGEKSFFNQSSYKFLIADSLSFMNLKKNYVGFENDTLKILPDTTKISVLSAGTNAGATCVISKDGINLLSNTFFAGMGIAVFDNVTLEVDTATWFSLFNQPANVEALATLIDSIPSGKIVAIGVADDAANNISVHLKNAIKSLGSAKIDSLKFRDSWALIGWKGAPTGSVSEELKSANLSESVFLESGYGFLPDSGSFEIPVVGKASHWNKILISQSVPDDALTEYILFGKTQTGQIDSLREISLIDSLCDISDIDAKTYPEIFLKGKLKSSTDKKSPGINQIAVDFISYAELGTNYQVVKVSKDSVMQGTPLDIKFDVYNVGEVEADSFNVKVELVKPDNSIRLLSDSLISRIDTSAYISFQLKYLSNVFDGYGNMKFRITADPNNRVKEFYKDNNFFEKSFYVIQDTTPTSVSESTINILFDGTEILDGDFVGPHPEIVINLQYPAWFFVQDTSSIHFYLDGMEYYSGDIINSFDTVNRIATYKITPLLNDGDHLLQITGKSRLGNIDPEASVERFFVVNDQLNLLDVYNYPNPFSDHTVFTFRLSQLPEKLEIKIFTISGRLIKTIERNSAQLNLDFNRIAWDGKDEDGDIVASGVYLYKMILHKSGESVSVTQKLAVVR